MSCIFHGFNEYVGKGGGLTLMVSGKEGCVGEVLTKGVFFGGGGALWDRGGFSGYRKDPSMSCWLHLQLSFSSIHTCYLEKNPPNINMSEALLNFAAFYQYYGKLCVHGCCMTNNIRCLSAQDTYVLLPRPRPFSCAIESVSQGC